MQQSRINQKIRKTPSSVFWDSLKDNNNDAKVWESLGSPDLSPTKKLRTKEPNSTKRVSIKNIQFNQPRTPPTSLSMPQLPKLQFLQNSFQTVPSLPAAAVKGRDKLMLEKRRRSATFSIAKPKNAIVEDDVFNIDVASLRKVKSESYLFMHSWDYTPYFEKVKDLNILLKNLSKYSIDNKKQKHHKKAKQTKKRGSKFVLPTIQKKDLSQYLSAKSLVASEDDPKIIVSGQLKQLINKLSTTNTPDEWILMFLNSHKEVVESETLLIELLTRYKCFRDNEKENQNEYKKYQNQIIITISLWIENIYQDFYGYADMNAILDELIKELETEKNQDSVYLLKRAIDKNASEIEVGQMDLENENIPLPIVSQGFLRNTEFSIFDFHPMEVARQLTLLDFRVFQEIEPIELLHCNWTRAEKNELSPHIIQLIERFNAISYWVATEIVATVHKKKRIAVLRYFIELAQHLQEIRNYHALMSLFCAFNMHQVQRLTQTWAGLPSKDVQYMKRLEVFLDSKGNWGNLRKHIAQILEENKSLPKKKHVPVLPFHGTYLRSFIGIDENTTLLDNHHVNVEKLELISKQFMELRTLQKSTFKLLGIARIQDWLLNIVKDNEDDDSLLVQSKKCESSREASMSREKEKDNKENNKEKEKKKDKKEKRGFFVKTSKK